MATDKEAANELFCGVDYDRLEGLWFSWVDNDTQVF